MTKFFITYDKIKKWLVLATFALVLLILFVPFKKYSSYFEDEILFLKALSRNEIYFVPSSLANKFFSICLIILEKLSMIAALSLSIIFIIFCFLNKKCYFSIPMALYFFSMLLKDNNIDYIDISLYYKITSFILFAAWLTLELLSKYRDKAIAKFDPIIAKRAEKRALHIAEKQAQQDAEYKQSPEYRIEQLEKELQELKEQRKPDDRQ